MPPLEPTVADSAPDEPALTSYDEQHAVTYARLLDAEADKADWHEVARIVLRIDPASEPARALMVRSLDAFKTDKPARLAPRWGLTEATQLAKQLHTPAP